MPDLTCKICGKQLRQRSRLDREIPRDTCKSCLKSKRKKEREVKQLSLDHEHRLSPVWRWLCPGCNKKKITLCPKKGTCITCCINGGYENDTARRNPRIEESVEGDVEQDFRLGGRRSEIARETEGGTRICSEIGGEIGGGTGEVPELREE